MMTSTPVTQQQQTDGRTVREVVEFNQELVNEVWCRRIFRQILQSLELQYAMQMPHRPINPDTVLVLDSGDPMLLPSDEVGSAWSEAGDMHDLAAVVHYAITREYPPAAPLQGRPLGDDYSAGFVAAVDRCLAPDPQGRPHNIEQLRNLLGIVPLGPALQAQAVAAAPPEPAVSFLSEPRPAAEPGRLRRWLLLTGAATVLLVALGALLALLHGADTRDAVTLALPEETAAPPAAAAALPAPEPGADTAADPVPAAAPAAPEAPLLATAGAQAAPVGTAGADALAAAGFGVAPVQATPAVQQAGAPAPAIPQAAAPATRGRPISAATGASYKLVIKPWGMVQVNGVDRGASPPLKRLNLPPGQHTIRIVNPNFPEHTVTVNAVRGASSVIELDFTEEGVE